MSESTERWHPERQLWLLFFWGMALGQSALLGATSAYAGSGSNAAGPPAANTNTGTVDTSRDVIVYFDPDANYQVFPDIIARLEQYLQSVNLPVKVLGAHDHYSVRSRIAEYKAKYVIIAPHHIKDIGNNLAVTPLMAPESQGAKGYKKVLVDRSAAGDPVALGGKRIAVAGLGGGPTARERVRGQLVRAELPAKNAEIMLLSKDIDALFALAIGQAEAALVTEGSVELLRTLDRTTAESLRRLWVSPVVSFPPLSLVENNATAATDTKAIVDAFAHMHERRAGRAFLKLTGFEKWDVLPSPHKASTGGLR